MIKIAQSERMWTETNILKICAFETRASGMCCVTVCVRLNVSIFLFICNCLVYFWYNRSSLYYTTHTDTMRESRTKTYAFFAFDFSAFLLSIPFRSLCEWHTMCKHFLLFLSFILCTTGNIFFIQSRTYKLVLAVTTAAAAAAACWCRCNSAQLLLHSFI